MVSSIQKQSAMEGKYLLIKCFSISFGILATPSHTLISLVHKRGGRREMKWPASEAPYFLFSSLYPLYNFHICMDPGMCTIQ